MGAEQSGSRLNNQVVSDLRSQTKFSAKEIQDLYEKFHSDFPEGVITRDSFVTMYSGLYPNGDARQFARLVFNAYDRDGDGKVDFQEFMCTLSVASKGTVDEKLRWAFHLYDLDGTGEVSRHEAITMITAIYRMQGEPRPREKAEEAAAQLFMFLDKDRDDMLSESEFLRAAKGSSTIRGLLGGGQ